MKKFLAATLFVLTNLLALNIPAHAQSGPPVIPELKRAVAAIPIPGIKGAVDGMFSELKQFKGGNYSSTTTINMPGVGKVPLQLYVFGTSHRQAVVVVVNATIAMPKVFNNSAWKRMAGTTVTDPIFSLSTMEFSIDPKDMPDEFKRVVANSYFNVPALDFNSGLQVAFKAHIGGIMKTVIETGLGVPVKEFTLRAGVMSPIPMDPNASASLALSIASDLENVATTFKDMADFYVEYQLEPGKTIRGPLGMTQISLTDVTISMNNKGVIGYKGNMVIPGGKKFITFFNTTINPAGVLDVLDFQFGMAAQNVTLADVANLMIAQETSTYTPNGYILSHIPKFKSSLEAAAKPLSVVQLRNPKTLTEYKFGDKTKPFPPLSSFNFLEFGPLASVDDLTGRTIQGPYLKVMGDAVVLGQKVGSMDVVMGINGLHAKAKASLNLKLGPLGRQGIGMAIDTDVDANSQRVFLHGNVLGRVLDVTLNGAKLSIISPATCATPFELTGQFEIKENMDLASVLDGMPGVNVDPAKLPGCVGAELEKAYKWVSTTGASLGGYSAAAASQELTKISNATAEAAVREYERAKDLARDKANKTASDAMRAFNDAGNVFKKLGKKKRRKAPPDPRMEGTVFDWDYYYDNNPDVVKSGGDLAEHWRNRGVNEGRRGSPEFDVKFYLARYIDVKKSCGSDRLCAIKHWVNDGIDEGRQGSADVAVASYLNRYPDLQRAFGKDNYPDALDHLMNSGPDRNGRPDSNAPGQVSGPKQIGGDGGSRWNDYDQCAGQYVTGFKVNYGDRLDAIQFHYNGRGWANAHGNMGKGRETVMLAAGEYIVQVDYKSGSRGTVDGVTFKSSLGKSYGPYGGKKGSSDTYSVTPGEKLGCMAGRSGDEIDKLLFSSTGPR